MAKRPSISSAIWVLTIGLLVIGGMVAYNTFGAKIGGISTGTSGGDVNIVTSSTALSFNAADALNLGTAVSPATSWIAVGGESVAAYATGVTTASPGQVLDILVVNNSQYHNVLIKNYVVPNAPTASIPVKMTKNGTVTMSLFNTNNAVMTNGATGTNQTVAAGGSYNMEIRLDGTDATSTQEMRCIFESSNTTAMDKVTLSGLGARYVGMAKPASYSIAGATSGVWVYDIDSLNGAVSSRGVINVKSKTAQTLAMSSLKITCQTKEYFIDSQSGKVIFDIENAAGTLKAMSTYTGTYYFQ